MALATLARRPGAGGSRHFAGFISMAEGQRCEGHGQDCLGQSRSGGKLRAGATRKRNAVAAADVAVADSEVSALTARASEQAHVLGAVIRADCKNCLRQFLRSRSPKPSCHRCLARTSLAGFKENASRRLQAFSPFSHASGRFPVSRGLKPGAAVRRSARGRGPLSALL